MISSSFNQRDVQAHVSRVGSGFFKDHTVKEGHYSGSALMRGYATLPQVSES